MVKDYYFHIILRSQDKEQVKEESFDKTITMSSRPKKKNNKKIHHMKSKSFFFLSTIKR